MQAESKKKKHTHIYALEHFSATPDICEKNMCNLPGILLSKNEKKIKQALIAAPN